MENSDVLIQEAHEKARREGRDVYIDPVSLKSVFTQTYLIKRGYCCGNLCRHCPYEPKHLENNKTLRPTLQGASHGSTSYC